MLFHLTPEDHIRTSDEQRRTETDGGRSSFASEQELQELASQWPMKRLVEIWNRLPGIEPVTRFTDRKTAIARIWRAIQPRAEKGGKPARRASQSRHRPCVSGRIQSGTGLQFVVPAGRRHPEPDSERNRMAGPHRARLHLAQSVETRPESALV